MVAVNMAKGIVAVNQTNGMEVLPPWGKWHLVWQK
jgi:hypothetical protein